MSTVPKNQWSVTFICGTKTYAQKIHKHVIIYKRSPTEDNIDVSEEIYLKNYLFTT